MAVVPAVLDEWAGDVDGEEGDASINGVRSERATEPESKAHARDSRVNRPFDDLGRGHEALAASSPRDTELT